MAESETGEKLDPRQEIWQRITEWRDRAHKKSSTEMDELRRKAGILYNLTRMGLLELEQTDPHYEQKKMWYDLILSVAGPVCWKDDSKHRAKLERKAKNRALNAERQKQWRRIKNGRTDHT